MSQPFIGQIVAFAGNFAPRNWQFCAGQLLSVSQNAALFAILGTTYGGNGQTTFALPDLRGRVIVGSGSGPGLSPYVEGQQAGSENVTLQLNQMPIHSHMVNVQGGRGTAPSPVGGLLAGSGTTADVYAPSPASAPAVMAQSMIASAGGSQPFSVLSPYTSINYIIAILGVFPSRN